MKSDEFLPSTLDGWMRWFVLPSEAHAYIKDSSSQFCGSYTPPFYPRGPRLLLQERRLRKQSRVSIGHYCTCSAHKQGKLHRRKLSCPVTSPDSEKPLNKNRKKRNSHKELYKETIVEVSPNIPRKQMNGHVGSNNPSLNGSEIMNGHKIPTPTETQALKNTKALGSWVPILETS